MKLSFKKTAKAKVVLDRFPVGAPIPNLEITRVALTSEILPHDELKEIVYPILKGLGYYEEDLEMYNEGETDQNKGIVVLCGPILEFQNIENNIMDFLEEAGMAYKWIAQIQKAMPPMVKVEICLEGS